MNPVLVTNVLTFVLLIAALAVVPILPGMIMKRFLSAGLAEQRAERRPTR